MTWRCNSEIPMGGGKTAVEQIKTQFVQYKLWIFRYKSLKLPPILKRVGIF